MANDELLRLTGASTGVQRETFTVDAAGGGGWKFVGPNKSGYVECMMGGLFDRTTGDETIAWQVRRADDASGTNSVTLSTSAIMTTNDRGVSSAATPNESLGDVRAPIRLAFNTTTAQQYISAFADMSGTTPSVAGASATIHVYATPVLNSGV